MWSLLRTGPKLQLAARVYDLDFASAERRRAMAERTFPLFSIFWPSFEFEKYVETYFSPRILQQRLYTWEDAKGEVVAFGVGGCIDVEVEGDKLTVIDGVTCRRADARNLSGALAFGAAHGTLHLLWPAFRRGRTPVMRLIASTPGGYKILGRSFPRVYPSRQFPVGHPRFSRWHRALREDARLEADPANPCLIEAVKIDLPDELREHWARSRDPDIRYFIEQCPDYGDTRELLAIVPLELRDVALIPYCMARSAAAKTYRKLLQAARPSAKNESVRHANDS